MHLWHMQMVLHHRIIIIKNWYSPIYGKTHQHHATCCMISQLKTYITDHLNCLQLDGCDETTNINMRDAMLMRWSERESDVKLAYNNIHLRYDNYTNIKQTHKNINTHMAIILQKHFWKWMNYGYMCTNILFNNIAKRVLILIFSYMHNLISWNHLNLLR